MGRRWQKVWDPYIKAVNECCPKASIVFDQFHAVSAFKRIIDRVRNLEFRRANKENLLKEEKPGLKIAS